MRVGILAATQPGTVHVLDFSLLAHCGLSPVVLPCPATNWPAIADDLMETAWRAIDLGVTPLLMPLGFGGIFEVMPDEPSLLPPHPPQLQVDSAGRTSHRACPNDPQFVSWLCGEMSAMTSYVPCAGVVWGEPSFAYDDGIWGCRCERCRTLFARTAGYDMPISLTPAVARFRRESIVMLLLQLTSAIRASNPRLRSVVMVTPSRARQTVHTGTEDWDQLLQSSAVDGIAIFACWQGLGGDRYSLIRDLGRAAARKASRHGKRAQLWLAGSTKPEDELLSSLTQARQLGVDEAIIWDYHGLVAAPDFPAFRPRLEAAIRRDQRPRLRILAHANGRPTAAKASGRG